MRVRATTVAVSGALVLAVSAFAVPAAYAAGDSASPSWAAAVSAGAGPSAFGAATAADATAGDLDVTFTNVKVNGGKAIAVGATKHVKVPVTYTLKHAAGLDVTASDVLNGPFLYFKSMPTSVAQDFKDPVLFGDNPATCVDKTSTTATCKAIIDIRPGAGDLANSLAGTWKVGGLAIRADEANEEFDETWQGKLGTVKVQRQAKLAGANAAPEPVKKGKTITVTSKLTRANWDTNKTPGYGGQPVKLQFKKKGTSVYKDVKTVKTSSTGAIKTTVKATADGSYRFVFAGSNGTTTATSAGDAIDVK
ncbi:hypothetical protein [Streptomyces tailanensis]|uniref:hypothetical protein n=1 Tax=Streptomyces tailanensis TaxID=2569858 RepID=UPI00122E0A20|nr:hypothetical protein [Streptomyces tailanensis]